MALNFKKCGFMLANIKLILTLSLHIAIIKIVLPLNINISLEYFELLTIFMIWPTFVIKKSLNGIIPVTINVVN